MALGKELLRSGSNVEHDVWKSGDLPTAQKKRGKELINKISNRVSDHMFGSGYSNSLGIRHGQLKGGTRGKKTQKAKKATKRKTVKSKTKKAGKKGRTVKRRRR